MLFTPTLCMFYVCMYIGNMVVLQLYYGYLNPNNWYKIEANFSLNLTFYKGPYS